MKFLIKNDNSPILSEGLHYDGKPADRVKLREKLLAEQKGFCAYSEKYISKIDSHAIEHFNPTLKHTSQDSYYNWYVVVTWMNEHKFKKLDERFLPIAIPYDITLSERIIYKEGIYQIVDKNDLEAQNLIEFLCVNRSEVCEERNKHIQRIKDMRSICQDEELFLLFLAIDKQNLSFLTALEAELGMNLTYLIE